MNNNLIDSRHIRLFISSTFQDLNDERDYLMRRTFPELRNIALERNVILTELDLRWGITEEEAKEGKVVEICFREIENSIPFFVGIIGSRYGWCPSEKDIDVDVYSKYAQIKDYINRHFSVTEMEMQFGVLERKEDMHAHFFIQEDSQKRFPCDNYEKLEDLKKKVISNGRYPVAYYNSKEDLSKKIHFAFIELLNSIFPLSNVSVFEKEKIRQDAFRVHLSNTYIPEERYFRELNNWLKNENSNHFVIIGDSGIGKSAFLASWISWHHSHASNYSIVYHFIGCGGNVENYSYVEEILCNDIVKEYCLDNDSIELNLKNIFTKVAEIKSKTLVIVLDGINQISESENSKLLAWIPIPPKNVKIVYSTLEDDSTMEIFKLRKYTIMKILSFPKKVDS